MQEVNQKNIAIDSFVIVFDYEDKKFRYTYTNRTIKLEKIEHDETFYKRDISKQIASLNDLKEIRKIMPEMMQELLK